MWWFQSEIEDYNEQNHQQGYTGLHASFEAGGLNCGKAIFGPARAKAWDLVPAIVDLA